MKNTTYFNKRGEEHLRKKLRTNYTRRQAIEGGQLVDVTDLAREVLRDDAIPVAMTDAALKVVSPHGTREATVERRTRELLHAASAAVVSRLPDLGRSPFEIKLGRHTVSLVIEFHEADEGGLVGTIMATDSLPTQLSGSAQGASESA